MPKDKSERGTVTIRVMGLNRAELLERRLKRHDELELLVETFTVLAQVAVINPSAKIQDLIRKTQSCMDEARADAAEYAAMARVTLG